MHKHIFLIGMMGCGKSTMGSLLSRRLACGFIDLDEEIVRYEGRSIPDIFADVGDAGFRHCETAALQCVIDEAPCIVATGGGIVTREENIALMRKAGLVIWLNRPLEEMVADVRQDTRPNLAGDKAERMRTLFDARKALYERAAHLVFSNHMPPDESALLLAQLIQEHKLA